MFFTHCQGKQNKPPVFKVVTYNNTIYWSNFKIIDCCSQYEGN